MLECFVFPGEKPAYWPFIFNMGPEIIGDERIFSDGPVVNCKLSGSGTEMRPFSEASPEIQFCAKGNGINALPHAFMPDGIAVKLNLSNQRNRFHAARKPKENCQPDESDGF